MATIDLERAIGLNVASDNANGSAIGDGRRRRLTRLVNLQLAATGLPTPPAAAEATNRDRALDGVAEGLFANFREKTRLLEDHRCPADRRIEAFLRLFNLE